MLHETFLCRMEYGKQSYCVYHIRYHVVISTKYCRRVVNKGVEEYLRLKIQEIHKHYPEIRFEKINVDKDHLYVLVSIPPKISISLFVNILKANTAKGLKTKFPFFQKVYWGADSLWSVWVFRVYGWD